MKPKEFDIFIADCLKGFCNRNTMYNNKTCKKEGKQKACYKKYTDQIEKKNNKFGFHFSQIRRIRNVCLSYFVFRPHF